MFYFTASEGNAWNFELYDEKLVTFTQEYYSQTGCLDLQREREEEREKKIYPNITSYLAHKKAVIVLQKNVYLFSEEFET